MKSMYFTLFTIINLFASSCSDDAKHSPPATPTTTLSVGGFNNAPNYIMDNQARIENRLNLKLNITDNNWSVHHTALSANLYESPQFLNDIEFIDAGMLAGYLHNENLMDLTDKFEPIKNNFPDFSVAHGINDESKQIAVPFELGPGVAIYRRAYMEDINQNLADVMATWESWLEYGRMLKQDHNVYLIANSAGVARAIIYSDIKENTGVYFGENNEILVETDRFKTAFQIAKILTEEELAENLGMWNSNWYEGFNNASFAMEFQGAWLLQSLADWIAEDTAGQWGVSHLPNGIHMAWGGTYLAISNNSKEKDAAWELVNYLIESQNQLDIYQQIFTFPANLLTYSDAYFDQSNPFLNHQKDRKIYAEVALNIKPAKYHRLNNVAETQVMNYALTSVLNGSATIDEALATAAKNIQLRLDEK
ncbi:extracellular solute-binding protein [Marinicellulosiphila megalodicopiae]|uniref:ABC transporter substrate-binding protein n=1 Tax=Marinicellulosiphila megalodicopiae TaxID=2724896 RepID=UPI003BAEF92E